MKIKRQNPGGGSAVSKWEGESNGDNIYQIDFDFGFGFYGYRALDDSTFRRSLVKDFPPMFGGQPGQIAKWITRKVRLLYTRGAGMELNASGTETIDMMPHLETRIIWRHQILLAFNNPYLAGLTITCSRLMEARPRRVVVAIVARPYHRQILEII